MTNESNQGHWTGLTADTHGYFGFIYVIHDRTTGRKYVGKKQFFFHRNIPGCKTKLTDRQSPKWKCRCWMDSGWRRYKGSSNSLKKWMTEFPDNDYEFVIVRLCRSKGTLHYAELQELWDRDVLARKLENGEYEYFNKSIGAIRFRPPAFHSEETILKSTRTGPEHGMYLEDELSFTHVETGEVYKGTRFDFRQHTGLLTTDVGRLCSWRQLSVKGWRLTIRKDEVKGHVRRDDTVHLFEKVSTGERFIGTRKEFLETFKDVKRRNLSAVMTGDQKTTAGWSLKEDGRLDK